MTEKCTELAMLKSILRQFENRMLSRIFSHNTEKIYDDGDDLILKLQKIIYLLDDQNKDDLSKERSAHEGQKKACRMLAETGNWEDTGIDGRVTLR
jgi:hypothetical protein